MFLCEIHVSFVLFFDYVLKKSYFICPITNGSVNALMKLAGFSTSNKVKNHSVSGYSTFGNISNPDNFLCTFPGEHIIELLFVWVFLKM